MSKIALLIGVSEYKAELARLPAAIKDAEEMQRVLVHPDIGGFDKVKVLTNPDLVTMQEEIETLFADRDRDDLVLLFFSGHGRTDEIGKFYFTTSETRKTSAGRVSLATTIPASFVHKVMTNSRSKHQVVILDCCYSGAFAGDLTAKSDGVIDVQSQLSSEGGAVLASSSPTEVSFEQHSSGLSVYTNYLVEGIDSGAADTGGDGHISVDELHQYAKKKVQAHAPLMRPQIYPLREGSHIILASAPISDPMLIYQRELERLASRGEISRRGKVSRSSRTMLEALREALNLCRQEALETESKVLMPHREYHKKLQRYRQSFYNLVRSGNSINSSRTVLERLQKALSLRPEDVDLIASNLVKQRSRIKSSLLTLVSAGAVISASMAGIYTRLYDYPSLSFLPDQLQVTLDQIHDEMHKTTLAGKFQLNQLSIFQLDPFRMALRKAIQAEKLIDQTERLGKEAQSLDAWKATASNWRVGASKLQEAINLMEKVSLNDLDYQEAFNYQQYLITAKKRAEAEAQFAQAMGFAMQASELVQTAKSSNDWKRVVEHWQQAIDQIGAVSPSSFNRSIAQIKAKEYLKNQAYARTRAQLKPKRNTMVGQHNACNGLKRKCISRTRQKLG